MRLIDADNLLAHKVRGEIGNLSGDFVPGFCIDREPTVAAWISVDERMPEDGETVLTVDVVDHMEVLEYDIRFPGVFCGCGGLLKVCNVTHWMPLPKLPEPAT